MQNDCFPEATKDWPKLPVSAIAQQNPRYPVKKGKVYPFIEMASIGEEFGGILKIEYREMGGSGLSRFKAKDTLFAKITPCPENGKIAYVDKLPAELGIGSTEFIVLSPLETTDPRFLFHIVCSHELRGRATARMEGSTGRQRIPDDVFDRRLLVPVPGTDEQASIVFVLDAVEMLIEKTRNTVEIAAASRRALMQAAFNCELTDEPRKNTDAGRIAHSWEALKGKQAFSVVTGGNSSVYALKPLRGAEAADAWFMKVADFNLTENARRITRTKIGFVAGNNPSFRLLAIGTIIIAKRGEAIMKNRVRTTIVPVALDPNLMALKVRKDIFPEFFRYQLEWRKLARYVESSGVPQLNNKDLYPRWFVRAPEDQQKYIVEVLSAAEQREDALRDKIFALKTLKKTLMHDLLTGAVRVDSTLFKKVARYQQFEAVNDIVDRTLSLVGKPVSAQDRTGLVWHTQGSGKSLTMIFAAYKLRRQAAMKNPTVMIVVDRRDLKTQISDDFDACDYPNVVKATGVEDLKSKLKTVWRGTLVTTVQSFQKMGDLKPLDEDNIITLVDECHRSQKDNTAESYAMTMRVKLPNAFRFGLTGTPIDRAMTNTHRDFGPVTDGEQERYLSYYGIKRAIKDGATLEVHYIRDKVPFIVSEKELSVGFERMCAEMELEDEEAKDLIQRQRSQWKELARHPDRVEIVIDKMLAHFLAYPDPSGFKAQLVGVDRKACVRFKDALDKKLKTRGLPTEWSDVIISEGQNDDEDMARFHYGKQKQDDLIDHFKLTPKQWEEWNHEAFGEDRSKWRSPLKILIVCDRLLTGFDAPVEQVMYLDKPLRDHNLLQAIARTNRPLPAMDKRTGVVVDYFGVFSDLAKALNFDENIREESLIDWDALKATVPGEVKRCMESFKDITIADTRECLLAALRAIKDPDASKIFEHNFKSLERLWEAVSPDPCLYVHRYVYKWLCGIYIAHRRRQRCADKKGTYGELSAKTRELIEENTTFMDMALALPVFKIDKDYIAKLDELPSAADKAALLEAILTAELTEDNPHFTYRQLGERLTLIKAKRDASDKIAEQRLKAFQDIAKDKAKYDSEPDRLGLNRPGEYALFTVLREFSTNKDEVYLSDCARRMVAHLLGNKLMLPGWSHSRGGRMRVEQSLLAESWNPNYAGLGFDPDDANPPFLQPAVNELVNADATS